MTRTLALVALVWAGSVALAAGSGSLARLWMPAIAGLVALGIAPPTLWYFPPPRPEPGPTCGPARHHRVPCLARASGVLFFWYGAKGELPTLFWLLAGTGDLIAGFGRSRCREPYASLADFERMHRFGFADFVIAVGTGLTFTLLLDPRMAPRDQPSAGADPPLRGRYLRGEPHRRLRHAAAPERAGHSRPHPPLLRKAHT